MTRLGVDVRRVLRAVVRCCVATGFAVVLLALCSLESFTH